MSGSARSDFTVIVPAYNEAAVVPHLIRELKESFERHQLGGDVILVDDGSSDGTGDIAEREANGWSRLQ